MEEVNGWTKPQIEIALQMVSADSFAIVDKCTDGVYRSFISHGRLLEMHNTFARATGSGFPPLWISRREIYYLADLLPKTGAVMTGLVTIAAIVLTIVNLVNSLAKMYIRKNRMLEKER